MRWCRVPQGRDQGSHPQWLLGLVGYPDVPTARLRNFRGRHALCRRVDCRACRLEEVLMADKVRRVDYSPDEYISGVGGVLSAAEQGVYWMVCSLIMSEGHPIENDERRVAGLCRMRPAEARRTIDRLIERGKIDLTEAGELAQKRAQSEVEKSAKRIQIAIENGSKGGRPKPKDKEKQ